MRILYVVQRYGEEVAGGAEQHVRFFAERLSGRNHEVHVATTCAKSYVDWSDHFERGDSQLNGVAVHRFSVANRRDPRFGDLHLRISHASSSVLLDVQREWMRLQGPETPELVAWLESCARDFDVIVFGTYLYWTTWAGLRAVAGRVPTVLHPTAHDEPMLSMSIFDETFRLADRLAFLTPEEAEAVGERFRRLPSGTVVGVGVAGPAVGVDVAAFRRRFDLGDRPYFCYVGRIDRAKAVDELIAMFQRYDRARPGRARLVLVGEPVLDLPDDAGIVATGYVTNMERDAAVAGAAALVQPSYYESFSLVLTEAFAAGRPAVVNGRCRVLAGHAQRSGGALTYVDEAGFVTALDHLLDGPDLQTRLGEAGREYVRQEYEWDSVLDRYEALLAAI